MVVGEGLLSAARFALRVVACGNALSLALESNLGRSFSSFPAWAEYLIADSLGSSGTFESDGGGGRIRTFEVDDGRFTVCSLWPLGNPTRGNSNFEVMLEMVVGEGLFVASLLTLRAVACGNVLSLSLESNLSRRFSPFPAWAEYLIADSLESSGTFESDGGGGRITQRCALRPSGRCLRQRSLAGARVEPWSKLLILPRMGRIFNCGFVGKFRDF